MKCTFLSKKLSMPLGKLIFSPLFSQLHTFLPCFLVGVLVGFCFFFVLGIPTPLPKKNKLLFANVLKVSFLRRIKKKAWLESFQTRYIFFGCSASLLCILFNICEVVGKYFPHQCRPSLLYFVLLTTWSTICTSKVFVSHEKELEAGWLSAKHTKNNQMILLISFPPPNLSVSRTLQKTICTLSEQKCFYYRNPPPSTWIVVRAFWTSAQSQHFGLEENKQQIVCLFGSRFSSHLEVPYLPLASIISFPTSSSKHSLRLMGNRKKKYSKMHI